MEWNLYSATGIGILVGFLVFVLLTVCLRLRHYVISERNQANDSSDERSMRRVNTSSILKDCQIIKYNFGDVKRWGLFHSKIYAKNSVCTICLEDFIDGEEVVLCPCKHCYHQHCIKDWLRMKNSCPMCKLTIRRSFLASETTPLLHVVWGFMTNRYSQIFSIITYDKCKRSEKNKEDY